MTGSEKNVFQRMHAVANEIGTVEKNGRNTFHNYDYATEASFVHALRPLLYKHGLVIIPSIAAPPTVDNGITTVSMRFTVINIDKPEEKVDMIIPAQGQDKGDKGVYKALTGAKKYFIALAFMVPTGDDPEKEDKVFTPKTVKAEATTTVTTSAEAAAPRRASFRKPLPVTATASNGSGDDI